MKLMGSLISTALRDADGGPFVRHMAIDTKAIHATPEEAKLEMRRNAYKTARHLELGKEGRDWDFIISEMIIGEKIDLDGNS